MRPSPTQVCCAIVLVLLVGMAQLSAQDLPARGDLDDRLSYAPRVTTPDELSNLPRGVDAIAISPRKGTQLHTFDLSGFPLLTTVCIRRVQVESDAKRLNIPDTVTTLVFDACSLDHWPLDVTSPDRIVSLKLLSVLDPGPFMGISTFKNLTELSIVGRFGFFPSPESADEALQHVQELGNLKRVRIDVTCDSMTAYAFAKLAVESLVELRSSTVSDQMLSLFTRQCPHLSRVDLSNNHSLTDRGVPLLAGAARLQVLSLKGCSGVSRLSLEELVRCRSLRELDISLDSSDFVLVRDSILYKRPYADKYEEGPTWRLSFGELEQVEGSFENLEVLRVSGWPTTSASEMARVLLRMRKLRVLDISGCGIEGRDLTKGQSKLFRTESDVAWFTQMKSLREVIVNHIPFGVSDTEQYIPSPASKALIRTLAKLPLERLEIDGCKDLDRSSMEDIRSMTTLRHLSIENIVLSGFLDVVGACVQLHSLRVMVWWERAHQLFGLSQLRELSIDGWPDDHRRSLSEALSRFTQLRRLTVEYRKMPSVSAVTSTVSALPHLLELTLLVFYFEDSDHLREAAIKQSPRLHVMIRLWHW